MASFGRTVAANVAVAAALLLAVVWLSGVWPSFKVMRAGEGTENRAPETGALVITKATRVTITFDAESKTPLTDLAAKEVRRYLYAVYGTLSTVRDTLYAADTVGVADVVVVIGITRARTHDASLFPDVPALSGEEHYLRIGRKEGTPATAATPTVTPSPQSDAPDQGLILLYGAEDKGALYAAYKFAEVCGVRFALHGDLVPSPTSQAYKVSIPFTDDVQRPAFAVRGIHPFADFPEGPDWWTADDYKAHVSQVAKLRMNFFGLHTYPYGQDISDDRANEPTVWVGVKEDIQPDGAVAHAYPTSYASTLRNQWGYTALKTSAFLFGASALFDTDCYGSPVQAGMCPFPTTEAESSTVFARTAALLRDTFAHARTVGVKSCLGTEIPLGKPGTASNRAYYDGIFARVAQETPVDYYWLWTPEAWEWQEVDMQDPVVQNAVSDLKDAYAARAALNGTFELATCGWVLGPKGNRAYLDSVLPDDYILSSIDMNLGGKPVDPAYADVRNHRKWVIPWLEDDGNLAAPQFWAGRMFQHAADALKYGAEGLLGIHWRTRVIAPAFSALAQAGWQGASLDRASDFWADWAAAEFGSSEGFAGFFTAIDKSFLAPSNWGADGPGGLKPDTAYCPQAPDYDAFPAALEGMRGNVRGGAGEKERYEYWVSVFRYTRDIAACQCSWGQYNDAVGQVKAVTDRDQQRALARALALPARVALVGEATSLVSNLLQYVSTPGDLGTLYNVLSHSLAAAITVPEAELLSLLGVSVLPPNAVAPTAYAGPTRLIVPTARGNLQAGETLRLRALLLGSDDDASATVEAFVSPLGAADWTAYPLRHNRAGTGSVWSAEVPAGAVSGDVEYYVEASVAGQRLQFPSGAPDAATVTVVVN